jgi:hypothetical protein
MISPTTENKHDHPDELEFAPAQSINPDSKADRHLDLLLKSDLDHLTAWQTAWRFRKVSHPRPRVLS